ncbi:unnamed protein product [Pleuronectes platessa]|uniref:Uncharacterized protein n=1 Tax=Pleuronectes platessa TaxID=8262 RepID=A0A9N7VWK6_PLEPL|nr:unnamed protein product [Pleuronectes platessa]
MANKQSGGTKETDWRPVVGSRQLIVSGGPRWDVVCRRSIRDGRDVMDGRWKEETLEESLTMPGGGKVVVVVSPEEKESFENPTHQTVLGFTVVVETVGPSGTSLKSRTCREPLGETEEEEKLELLDPHGLLLLLKKERV